MYDGYKYIAFISYKREDEKYAKWLQYRLEHYKLPSIARQKDSSLPKMVRPVFRDTTDLTGGVLEKVIKDGLDSSKYLIIVCSPRAAQSEWVCKEVQEFIDSGREEYIIPYIIEGEPNAKEAEKECFPENLRALSGSRELKGININEGGRDLAAIKIIAHILGLQLDILWERWAREKKIRRRWIISLTLLGIFMVLAVAGVMFFQQRRMQENLARAVANRAEQLIDEGDSYLARKLLVEVLPDENDILPYPYTAEAEAAMRRASGERMSTIKPYRYEHGDHVANIEFSPDAKLVLLKVEDGDWKRRGSFELYNIQSGELLERFYAYAVFSPDGKYILNLSGGMNLWSIETREHLDVFDNDALNVYSAGFSPNGKHIVSISSSGMVKLWEINNGECDFQCNVAKIDDMEENCSIEYTADGKYLVYISSGYDEAVVKIWSVDTAELLNTVCVKHDDVDSIELTCDMEYIISQCSIFETTKIWSIRSGKCIQSIDDMEIKLSPDGKYIASAADNQPLKLWSIKTGECSWILDSSSSAENIIFSPDGKYIAYGMEDNIYLRSIESKEFLQRFEGVRPKIFSRSGKYIVFESIYGDYIIGTIDTGECEFIENGHIFKQLSPDDQYLASTCEGYAKLFLVKDKECHKVLELDELLHALNTRIIASDFVSYSQDGKNILSLHEDSVIRIWDVNRGECIQCIKSPSVDAKFTPDGKYVISAPTHNIFKANTAINFWSVETGKLIWEFWGHTSNIYAVECSPDGKYIVSASEDKTIKLWSLETGECLHTFEGHTSDVYSVAYSPNGKCIVSASRDRTVKLWSLETKSCMETKYFEAGIIHVGFSNNGEDIVLVDENYTTILYSVINKKTIGRFNYYYPKLRTLSAFTSNDGRYLISASGYDVALWDICSGKQVYTFKGHSGAVNYVASNPGGGSFASASSDGTIRFWNYQSLQELVEETKVRFKDTPLTPEEREEYYLY